MNDPSHDKTRLIRRSSGGGEAPASPPRSHAAGIPQDDPEATVYGRPQQIAGPADQTRIVRRTQDDAQAPDDGRTVLVRRSSSSGAASEPSKNEESPEGPVVGWLVVLEGPGRGKSVPLGYGMNTIGRDPSNRAPLPFGDPQMSRVKHATLAYDPRGRKFFIQHGDSTNLTYLGDAPVLAPTEIASGQSIRLGDSTVLRFVALCGPDFHWD